MPWVYGIQSGLFIKVGVAEDIKARLRIMHLYNPHPCKVVMRYRLAEDAYWFERRLHEVLTPYAIGREWFAVDKPLLRAAAKIVKKKLVEMQIERAQWGLECLAKEEQRELTRGRNVDSSLETAKTLGVLAN